MQTLWIPMLWRISSRELRCLLDTHRSLLTNLASDGLETYVATDVAVVLSVLPHIHATICVQRPQLAHAIFADMLLN